MRYRTIGEGANTREVSAIALGAMKLGGTVDEETSFAILDRFVEAGGTFIDTANNYMFWEPGCSPDDSETLVGSWREARGASATDGLTIATKLGARPTVEGGGVEAWEGLSEHAVRNAVTGSLERLRTDRLDLLYPHVEDRTVAIEETLGTLADLGSGGTVDLIGASNHAAWRLERARGLSAANGWPRYTALQLRYSYLQPRLDIGLPQLGHVHATPDHLDFVREENEAGRPTALVTYTPLLYGSYVRTDRELPEAYDHPGTVSRRAALADVSAQTGRRSTRSYWPGSSTTTRRSSRSSEYRRSRTLTRPSQLPTSNSPTSSASSSTTRDSGHRCGADMADMAGRRPASRLVVTSSSTGATRA